MARPTITASQVYGPSMRGLFGEGASEAASGPEALQDVDANATSIAPAVAILALIGILTVIRLAWEYAGE